MIDYHSKSDEEMEELLLNNVILYKMTKEEAKAWKICILYLQLRRKHFPNYKNSPIPKGDPRGSYLFKHAYKLLRETQDKIDFRDYRRYINAQFEVLKNATPNKADKWSSKSDCQMLVEPGCMVGEKAWNRWMKWKSVYSNIPDVRSQEEGKSCHEFDDSVIASLRDTKKYLDEKMNGTFDLATIVRWTMIGKITPYYLLLSPLVSPSDLSNIRCIDFNVYKVTDKIRTAFNDIYGKEEQL